MATNTSGWTKIPGFDYNLSGLDEDGGRKHEDVFKTNVKSRMINYDETVMLGCSDNDNSCSIWLYANLSNDNKDVSSLGFWISIANHLNSYYAETVYHYGFNFYNLINDETRCGVRSVIKLLKS
ncbi:MAG: hypothetical protein RR847_01410 [Bacilli bacterium]